jgi:hypothetical protein
MDPVTLAVVTAVIGAAGTVIAAWVQGRAQRSAKRADRHATDPGEPVLEATTSTLTDRELLPDDRR